MNIIFYYIAFILLSTNISAQYGHWEKLETVNNPGERWGTELAPIGDHMAILFGGYRKIGKKLDDTWIFDYKTRIWTQIISKNSPEGRENHTLTQISENKVLLFGGEADSIISTYYSQRGDVWIFDLDSMNWYKVFDDRSDNHLSRYAHRAAKFNDSTVLIFSGNSSWPFNLSNDFYLFNFKNNTMSQNLQEWPIPMEREYTHMDRIKDNMLFIYGGHSFNGDTNDNWWAGYQSSMIGIRRLQFIKSNCIEISHAGMRHIRDGYVLLFGGGATGSNPNTWYDGSWLFDFYNLTWYKLELTIHPIGRAVPGLALIDTNTILMYGGIIKGAPDNSYKTETWIFVLDSVPTEVPDVKNISEIIITPNPASDYIEINVPRWRGLGVDGVIQSEAKDPFFRIYDVLGIEQPTSPQPLSMLGEGVVRLDVSHLAPGVYFVRVGDVVRKFIKL